MERERGRDLQDLYRAILEALASGGQIRYEDIEDWLEGEESEGKKQLDQILKALLERMLEEGYITLPGQEADETRLKPQGYCRIRRRERSRQVRADQQGDRFPRLSYAAGSLVLAGPEQRGAPRHAGAVHGGRGFRGAQALRVRRHPEPGHSRHVAPRRPTRGADQSALAGLRRPPGPPGGIPEFVRYRSHAGLQSQHDPVRRGPVHAGQTRGPGAGAPDPDAVSGGHAQCGFVPRQRRGGSHRAACPGHGRTVPYQHPGRAAAGPTHP